MKFKSNIQKIKAPKILTQNEIKNHMDNIYNEFIESCYLFGSYSKNKAGLFSDIDILLVFNDVEYKDINTTISSCKKYFSALGYICNPIYTYIKYLKEDSNILIRQYIKNGILLFGDNLTNLLPYESDLQLQQKEYKDYWKANYLKKLEALKLIFKEDSIYRYDLLHWQYIYLVVYWYAKAQLTLKNKQHSLNEYTLIYIYENMLNKNISKEDKFFLNTTDTYRKKFYNDQVEDNIQDPKEFFPIIVKLTEGLNNV